MADIIPFRRKAEAGEGEADDMDIDLLTAVDAAIRDLRDVSLRWGEESSRLLVEDCLSMLERAFSTAG